MISSSKTLVGLLAVASAALAACSDDTGSTGNDEVGDGDGDATTGDGDGDPTTGDGDPTTGDGDGDGDGASCDPLPAPEGNVIEVTPAQAGELQSIVASAQTGDTISLADGTYDLAGALLWISTPGVTLRSQSGDREAVILDGGYETTEIVTIAASNVTVADLTLTRAFTHPIHVVSSDAGDTIGTVIYNVHIIDPREQAIKINPAAAGKYVDDGLIACSHIELTDEGRPHVQPNPGGCYTGGVDAHQARNWHIRDNRIEGFWCDTGLAEHAVHAWRACRDTLVERNLLLNNARGVGFGLVTSGDVRSYEDAPCPEAGDSYIGHYGGIVRNNFIFANDPGLLASPSGFDCGVCFWSACKATAVHNSVVATGDNFSSIEWRFASSVGVEIVNNIATHPLRERDGASANQAGNLENAELSLFVDGSNGDLHLDADASAAIDQGVSVAPGICDGDIDNQTRVEPRDIGADER